MQRCAPEQPASGRDDAYDVDVPTQTAATEPSLSTRQVAQLLGIGQATVKRLANAGGIGFLRSSRNESRRFAPEQVREYLRRTARETDFDSALTSADLAGCVAALMLEAGRGASLDELLDDYVAPAASRAPAAVVGELLARLPAMVAESHKPMPAFVAAFGEVDGSPARLVECSLRGHGYSVLMPAESQGASHIADVVDRVRARVVALLAGRETTARRGVAAVAAAIAGRTRGTLVVVHGSGSMQLARGVSRIRTMRDLGRLLRR
jgi:excisionase family DNA binding protein